MTIAERTKILLRMRSFALHGIDGNLTCPEKYIKHYNEKPKGVKRFWEKQSEIAGGKAWTMWFIDKIQEEKII